MAASHKFCFDQNSAIERKSGKKDKKKIGCCERKHKQESKCRKDAACTQDKIGTVGYQALSRYLNVMPRI